jgi:hypothetical protein
VFLQCREQTPNLREHLARDDLPGRVCDAMKDVCYLECGQCEPIALRLEFAGFSGDKFLLAGKFRSVTGCGGREYIEVWKD